jgi:vanillate O-demethylase ferredoxin subunit
VAVHAISTRRCARPEAADFRSAQPVSLHDDGPVLLLAAGIGITPLYAMPCNGRRRRHLRCTITSNAGRGRLLRELARHSPRNLRGALLCRGRARASGWRPCFPRRRRTAYLPADPGVYGGGRDAALEKGWAETQSTAKPLRLLPGGDRAGQHLYDHPASTGENGRSRRIRPSPRCCRIMAWRCRSPARWGSAAPA